MTKTEQTAQWVEGAKAGKARAIDALARAFLRPAYVVALSVLGRPSDAEDAAQDAMVLAIERIHTCKENEKFGAWVLQIVRNQAKNGLRRRRFRDVPKEPTVAMDLPDNRSTDHLGLRRDLLAALQVLSSTQREIVLLHDLEGWTHGEIAEALGVLEVTSRHHLFLARRVLRTELERETLAEGGVL